MSTPVREGTLYRITGISLVGNRGIMGHKSALGGLVVIWGDKQQGVEPSSFALVTAQCNMPCRLSRFRQ